MTKLTVEPQPRHGAGKALETHVQDFAARPAHTIVGIAELRRTKITTVDEGDGEDAVKVALLTFEPAPAEAGHQLRTAAEALRALRTAEGTLMGDMDAEVAEHTMKHLGGMLGFEEAARLKIGVKHWLEVLLAATGRPRSQMTLDDLLDDVRLATMGLSAVLDGVTEPAGRARDDGPTGYTAAGQAGDLGTGEIADTGNETEAPGGEDLGQGLRWDVDADESGYDGPTSPDLPPGHPGYRAEGGGEEFDPANRTGAEPGVDMEGVTPEEVFGYQPDDDSEDDGGS